MYCQSCGTAIAHSMKFCNRCGTSVVISQDTTEKKAIDKRLELSRRVILDHGVRRRTYGWWDGGTEEG